jgi:predicted nuclease of restriction endonuclease-like RecB superfamily
LRNVFQEGFESVLRPMEKSKQLAAFVEQTSTSGMTIQSANRADLESEKNFSLLKNNVVKIGQRFGQIFPQIPRRNNNMYIIKFFVQ